MTNEANDNNPRVSEAYRSFSTESTPPELDRRILTMAADDVPARYWIPRMWVRPVAWAATIALSLAFVLEMSQFADEPAAMTDSDVAETLEERVMSDEAAAKSKDESAIRQRLEKRTDAPALMKVAAPPAQSAPAPATAGATAMENASESLDSEADDMSFLREAEEQARMRSEPARRGAAFAEKKEQSTDCDEDARASAETWYECVITLRGAGHAEAARQEFDTLLSEFPDFHEPVAERPVDR